MNLAIAKKQLMTEIIITMMANLRADIFILTHMHLHTLILYTHFMTVKLSTGLIINASVYLHLHSLC